MSLSNYRRIRIRDDDILVSSSSFPGKEFDRFRGFHNTVKEDPKHFVHVLAILATEIQAFPECIDYIREETAAGHMYPEVHGLHHIDYASLPYNEVVTQLTEAKQFIINEFNYVPTLWYSPWGAGADERGAHLRQAALDAGLNLVTCEGMIEPSAMLYDVRAVKGLDRETGSRVITPTMTKEFLLKKWEGKEILRHWWSSVGQLNEIIKHCKDQ